MDNTIQAEPERTIGNNKVLIRTTLPPKLAASTSWYQQGIIMGMAALPDWQDGKVTSVVAALRLGNTHCLHLPASCYSIKVHTAVRVVGGQAQSLAQRCLRGKVWKSNPGLSDLQT